jgi:hypothetical protein
MLANRDEVVSLLKSQDDDLAESGLQAYLGNKKYGKDGMDALRKAGRDGASKEKMANIRAKYDKLDEESFGEDNPVAQAITRRIMLQRTDLLSKHGPEKVGQAIDNVADFVGDVEEIGSSDVSGWVRQVEQELSGVSENLDANQKRVGQLGPTEKVKNNNIGKLVGASESTESKEEAITEMDSEGYKGHREDGDPYAKGAKAKPSKAKDTAKDAEKALNKSMDKAHKKDVKEGQEDLEAILRLLGK